MPGPELTFESIAAQLATQMDVAAIPRKPIAVYRHKTIPGLNFARKGRKQFQFLDGRLELFTEEEHQEFLAIVQNFINAGKRVNFIDLVKVDDEAAARAEQSVLDLSNQSRVIRGALGTNNSGIDPAALRAEQEKLNQIVQDAEKQRLTELAKAQEEARQKQADADQKAKDQAARIQAAKDAAKANAAGTTGATGAAG